MTHAWPLQSGRFSYLDYPGPVPFAHRGGGAEAPENTWQAFEHALALGYRYMETDVRTTSDGVAVAMHDPTLDRVAHRPGRVANMSWAELSTVTMEDGRPVPRLDELLAAWPAARWNIDVKAQQAVAPTAEALRRAGALGRALVASFSGRRTAAVRRAVGPELATGAGRGVIAALVVARRLPGAPWPGRQLPAAVQVPVARRGVPIVDEVFIGVCHRGGAAVHIWTIDDAPTMGRLLDMGVDGVMTDRPTVLKEVLQARGQWHGGA